MIRNVDREAPQDLPGGRERTAMGASGTVVPARYTRRASARDQYA